MEKFTLEITLGDDMRSPDDLAWALRQVASSVQGGTGTGKIRDLCGDFVGKFDIEKIAKPACPDNDPACLSHGCPEHPMHDVGDHTYEQHHSPADHVSPDGAPRPDLCSCPVYAKYNRS
jgi:hypothetical protein